MHSVDFLNTLLGGTSKIWAGLYNGTTKEVSLSGHTHTEYANKSHTHSASDITGSITANPWKYITSTSKSVSGTGSDDFHTQVYTLVPTSYISYLVKVSYNFSPKSGNVVGGLSVATRPTNSGTFSWMYLGSYGSGTRIGEFTYGVDNGSLTTLYMYLFLALSSSTTTISLNATITIYGISSPL